MAMSAAKTGYPNHLSVYLITFSQCDSSELSRVQFAELIVEAWHTCSRSKIIQWVVSLEAHENCGNRFHMAIKLSSPARWLKVRNFVDDKYGIKLNFSNSHTNYYTAYEYVVKEDPNFVQSATPGLLKWQTAQDHEGYVCTKAGAQDGKKQETKASCSIRCVPNHSSQKNSESC